MTTHRLPGKLGGMVRLGLVYIAFVPVLPILALLTVGRVVFFTVIAILGSLRAWLLPPSDDAPSAATTPFWLAWLAALAILAAAIAAAVNLLAVAEDWPAPEIWLARGASAMLGLLALLAAYRLALAGTRSLQIALARNLALLIAFELERLRAAADQRVRHIGDHPSLPADSVEQLEVPGFMAERAEIRALLGEPTEQALTDLLLSMEEFNRTLAPQSPTRPTSVADIRRQAGLVCDRLAGAMQMLDPYLRGPA